MQVHPNQGRQSGLLPVILRLLLLQSWLAACLPAAELAPLSKVFFFFLQIRWREVQWGHCLRQQKKGQERSFPLSQHSATSPHPEMGSRMDSRKAGCRAHFEQLQSQDSVMSHSTPPQSLWTPIAQLCQSAFPQKPYPKSFHSRSDSPLVLCLSW